MIQTPFSNRRVMQNSWVVTDIHAAMRQWNRTAGIGPFFLVEGFTVDDQRYRGKPTPNVDATFALAQAGEIQIELVQQNNDANSAYRDTVPKGSSAFHHVAIYCSDYDRELADYLSAGSEVAFSASAGGKRYCYVDTSAALGCMVELIESSELQDAFFARIRAAAANWDGREPVRPAF
jgi:Glyoxalase/Bleomycin resistance protein/Dioxygenase superfamily